MPPFKIDENSTLGLAIEKFRQGFDEEAATLAEAALEEAREPDVQAGSAFVAGVARLWNCHHQEALGECSIASDHFEVAENFSMICSLRDECAPLRREARVWGEATQIVSEKLEKKLGEALEKIDAADVSYQPNNLRPPGLEVKKSKLLSKLSHFNPVLEGVHYVPLSVYSEFDLESGEWVSSVEKVYPYRKRVQATHTYEGWLVPRDLRSIFYTSADSIFALPVPDGFSIDAAHVEIDGSRTGFDLVESSDGIVYAKLKESSFGPLKLRFKTGPGGRQPSPSVNPASRKDLLGDVPLPDAVAELFGRTRFMGAREIYPETQKLVYEIIGYPTDGDILSGRAIFVADDGEEFFSKIWKMELADCDVANTLGVALLRHQGVPARLVTGYLIQDGAVGLHGWLEFFDPHRKEWVPGDMTPPLRPETSEGRKTENEGLGNDVVQPNVSVSHPFRMTKQEEKPAYIEGMGLPKIHLGIPGKTMDDDWQFYIEESLRDFWNPPYNGPVDRFWTFRGNKMVLSKPDGRYIVTLSEKRDEVVAYDFEKERWINLPIIYPNVPHDVPAGPVLFEPIDENWEAYETPEGLMVELNTSLVIGKGSGGPYLSWVVLEGDPQFRPDFLRDARAYQDPKVTENKIYFTKFPKVIALVWPKDNPDTHAFRINSYRENAEGEVDAIVQEVVTRTNQSSLNKHYHLHLEPPQLKLDYFWVARDMLGSPICEGTDYNSCQIVQSPDGSHFVVWSKITKDGDGMITEIGNRLQLFRDDFENYRFVRPTALCDEIACGRPAEWIGVRVNNDGSVVVKERDNNRIRTLNLDGEGKPQYEKDRLWETEDEEYGKDLVLYRFDENGKRGQIARLFLGMLARDYPFEKIAWDGNWASYLDHTFRYDPGSKTISERAGLAISLCLDQESDLLCLNSESMDVGASEFLVRASGQNYYEIGAALPLAHQLRAAMDRGKDTTLWEGPVEKVTVKGIDLDGVENVERVKALDVADVGIVYRREERVPYLLREFLKDYEKQRGFPPSESLRPLLENIAQRPEMDVFYEWPLIGAAKLFEAEEICLASESPECSQELRAAEKFRNENGPALANRFAPHLKESAHFPNRSTVVEAWSAHLLSNPALLKEMLAENPSLAAEAVFRIVERGMFDPRYFPKMSLEEEAKLTMSLKVLLTLKRDRLYRQMERTQPIMVSSRWEAYQHFSQTIAKRFSQNVFPSSAEGDW